MQTKNNRITARIEPILHEQFLLAAHREKTTASDLLRQFITHYVKHSTARLTTVSERRDMSNFSLANSALEGLNVSSETKDLIESYVSGTASIDEIIEQTIINYECN